MEQIPLKLNTFEGPLDLLLHLIGKNKVSLYDIPISEITEQYLEYLHTLEKFDIEISSEFLVVASNLLYIKSKMILPNEDDEEIEEDPRLELAKRLSEYKKIKAASLDLSEIQFNGYYNFFKIRDEIEPMLIDESLKKITLDDLYNSVESINNSIEIRRPVRLNNFNGIVNRKQIPILGVVKSFISKLKSFKKIKWHDLFFGVNTREEAVASFLAVLELVKMNRVDVLDTKEGYELSYKEGKEN